jgi:hypothetical protein
MAVGATMLDFNPHDTAECGESYALWHWAVTLHLRQLTGMPSIPEGAEW